MKKEKINHNGKISVPLVLLILILAVITVGVVKLAIWNHSTVVLEDVVAGTYDTESRDSKFYIMPEYLKNRNDDGINDMLVIGNGILTNEVDTDSVLSRIEALENTKVTSLILNNGFITSPDVVKSRYVKYPLAPYTLYYIVKALHEKNYLYQKNNVMKDYIYFSKEEMDLFLETLEKVNLEDYDTLFIMYSSLDYHYQEIMYNPEDEYDVTTYTGALNLTLKLLREEYPWLRVVVSSGCLTWEERDGKVVPCSMINYGSGNESEYIARECDICDKYDVSFIDNYSLEINESNVSEYVDKTTLKKKGIETVGNHITEYFNNR